MADEIYPIGSVVKLKHMEKLFMIYGIMQQNKQRKGMVFDYIAVPYPEGQMDSSLNCAFNNKDIEQVVFTGYEDPSGDRMALMAAIETALNEKANCGQQEKSNTSEIENGSNG